MITESQLLDLACRCFSHDTEPETIFRPTDREIVQFVAMLRATARTPVQLDLFSPSDAE